MEAYSTLLNVDVEAASKLAAFIAELLPEDAKEAYFEECSSLVQQSRSYDLLVKFLDQSGIILTSDADAEAVFQGMVSIIFTIEDQKQATQITERLLKELTSNNDNSRLCLRILVSLLNLFVTPITKFAALQTILAFASTSKQEVAVSHLSVSVVQWSADWNLSSDQKRDLFAAMASVLAAAKQTAKSLSFSLLVLQVSCASAADVSTIIKTAMELPPAEAPLRNEVFTVVTSYCKSVTSDAAVAPLLQLLQCVSEGDVKGFKSFAALVTSLGADAEAKARRTLLIMSLCRAIAAQGKGSACTVSYATAAAALDLSINEQQNVESWIVDAVGAGVLDASLNQIEQCINVTRCLQPAFGKQQWKELADQLNVWKTSALAVHSALTRQDAI